MFNLLRSFFQFLLHLGRFFFCLLFQLLGSLLNLLRWVSPRAIKETFNPPVEYPYPFMGAPAKEDLNLDKGGF